MAHSNGIFKKRSRKQYRYAKSLKLVPVVEENVSPVVKIIKYSPAKNLEKPDNLTDNQINNEAETPRIVDQVESTDNSSQEEEAYETTSRTILNGSGPPSSKKRKVATEEKHLDEANPFLKKIASNPKAAKDDCEIFCDLMCLKLRELNMVSRERIMCEIFHLMFYYKHQISNPTSTPISFAHQWPGMNHNQLPNHGTLENPSSQVSSVHAATSLDEANPLKKIASSPKAAKDDCEIFCDLMCLKLRELNMVSRERIMCEIFNLMFYYKHQISNPTGTPIPFTHHWPGMNHNQLPNHDSLENPSSQVSSVHAATQSCMSDDEEKTPIAFLMTNRNAKIV